MFRLETERLVLREWRDEDLDALHRLAADPRVMRYITEGRPRTREQSEAALERQMARQRDLGYCMWAVEERDGGDVIGLNGIQPLFDTGDVEIGWWLRPDRWGRGLATEGARRGMAYAFEELRLSRLVAIADPRNAASLNVMRKLGMRRVREVTLGELGSASAETAAMLVTLHRRDNPADRPAPQD